MSTILRQGSVGPLVKQLKRRLVAEGATLPLTHTFDAATHAAVVEFQSTHKTETGEPLAADGVVGKATWLALGGVPEIPPERANLRGFMIMSLAYFEAARRVREVGGRERGPDVEKYQKVTSGHHELWCASFVSWCYFSCGVGLIDGNGSKSVAALKKWAVKHGHWRPRTTGYTPPSGAVVIFKFSHTGIVVEGAAAEDRTVEGNTWSGEAGSQRNGDGVYLRSRNHSVIDGYIVVPEIVL
jgi:hypothetical protein